MTRVLDENITFSHNMSFFTFTFNQCFANHFHGVDHIFRLVTSQIDFAERTFADASAKFEVIRLHSEIDVQDVLIGEKMFGSLNLRSFLRSAEIDAQIFRLEKNEMEGETRLAGDVRGPLVYRPSHRCCPNSLVDACCSILNSLHSMWYSRRRTR